MPDALMPSIDESFTPDPYTDNELIVEILHWYLLEGCRSAETISAKMRRPDLQERVGALLRDPRCKQEICKARREIVSYTLDQIRKNLPRYFREMHGLATDKENKKVQYSALSKMFDMAGVNSATKGAGTTPTAYRDAVKDLMPDEGDEDGVEA